MKKQIATVLVLALALVLAWKGKRLPNQANSNDPRAVIYEMLTAGKAGDVDRYVASYADPMAATLRRTISAQYLREGSDPVRGVALSDPQEVSANEARIEVKFIYQDRTEAQMFYVSKNAGGQWRIARTEDSHHAETLVPYGTPIRLARRNR